jgi:hypothetical protein
MIIYICGVILAFIFLRNFNRYNIKKGGIDIDIVTMSMLSLCHYIVVIAILFYYIINKSFKKKILKKDGIL